MRAFLVRLRPFAPLALRLMLAALAITFSMSKVLRGMGEFTRQVTAWGLQPVWAQVLAWASLASGFLMVLGFLTRLGALALGAVTAMILWKTKMHSPWSGGLDFPLLTLAACLSIALSGAGRPSLDARLFGE